MLLVARLLHVARGWRLVSEFLEARRRRAVLRKLRAALQPRAVREVDHHGSGRGRNERLERRWMMERQVRERPGMLLPPHPLHPAERHLAVAEVEEDSADAEEKNGGDAEAHRGDVNLEDMKAVRGGVVVFVVGGPAELVVRGLRLVFRCCTPHASWLPDENCVEVLAVASLSPVMLHQQVRQQVWRAERDGGICDCGF